MTKQTIIGGPGVTWLQEYTKINSNFTELYGRSEVPAGVNGDHLENIGGAWVALQSFNQSSVGDPVSYSNSINNIGKEVYGLGNQYDIATFGKQTLHSTSSPGANTVCIGLWQRADLLGGTPNHMVGLLGEATSSDASTPGVLIGTEGKTYANINNSNVTSLLALTYLNASDNSNSVAYGVQANVSALQGGGTGTAVGGFFNASGGANNYDIMLAGEKNIVGWNSTFTGMNYLTYSDIGIMFTPTIGGNTYVNSGLYLQSGKSPVAVTGYNQMYVGADDRIHQINAAGTTGLVGNVDLTEGSGAPVAGSIPVGSMYHDTATHKLYIQTATGMVESPAWSFTAN